MSRRAVFLDRDGTLIERYDYLVDEKQVVLLPRTVQALRMLQQRGFLLVVVTNQSAVARGLLTEKQLHVIHRRLEALLNEQGVTLEGVYYCPYHPEGSVEQYRRESDLRKPGPGMLLQAARELDIDLSRSWMVGDDHRDILAGKAAGCRTILIDPPGSPWPLVGDSNPTHRVVNIQEAANCILHHRGDSPAGHQPETGSATVEPSTSPVPEEAPAQAAPPTTSESLPAAPQEQDNGETVEEAINKATGTNNSELRAAGNTGTASKMAQDDNASGSVAAAVGEDGPRPEECDSSDITQLWQQMLRELRMLNRQQRHGDDFSVARLFAGMTQMGVILCVIMAFWFGTGAESNTAATHTTLLLGILLQLVTLTLLTIHHRH